MKNAQDFRADVDPNERSFDNDPHPNLLDGTRAMELTEAVGRSLRRNRTIDLHYEEISELGNFKSVMTSTGCGLILLTLLILPVALIGPTFGFTRLIYLAWAIPPLLVLFALLQFLRFALPSSAPRNTEKGPVDSDRQGRGSRG